MFRVISDSLGSVQSRFSRVCCHLHTTRSSWISCSPLPPGMHMPNCGFTPVPPSPCLKKPPRCLAPSSDVSRKRLARNIKRRSFHKRRQHVGAVKLLRQQEKAPPLPETHPQQASSNADSIYQHTNYMLSATTQIQYKSMAQLITIPPKWCVLFSQSSTGCA